MIKMRKGTILMDSHRLGKSIFLNEKIEKVPFFIYLYGRPEIHLHYTSIRNESQNRNGEQYRRRSRTLCQV